MAPNTERKFSEPSPMTEAAPRPSYGIRAVLFGPPGSGKGTQVSYTIVHIKMLSKINVI